MADMMLFPDTYEEFEKQYMMIDKEQIYSNGIEYIPCFRVRQWMEHIEAKKKHEANKMAQVASFFGKKIGEEFNIYSEYRGTLKCKITDNGLSFYYDAYRRWWEDSGLLIELLKGDVVIVDEDRR